MSKWVFLLFLVSSARAQDGLSLQFSPLLGTGISHSSGRNAPENPYSGLSLDISKMTFGKKYWQYDHHYPQMGLLAAFQTLGNREIYGSAITVLPYLEFNAWRFSRGIFQIKHGTGIGWVTRRFDASSNPENTLHSTHLNATSVLDAGFRFRVSDKSDLKLGGVLRHISNGGFQKPNSGSNTASAYLNYTLYLREKPAESRSFEPVKDFKSWRYRVTTSLGLHRKPESKRVVGNPQLSAMVFRQHNTRFRTGGGLEAGLPYGYDPQLAVYAEEEVQFTKMVTRYGLGVYVVNRRQAWEVMYSKVGIAWYPQAETRIPHRFFIGMMLKAHNFNAAHIELNTGYTF